MCDIDINATKNPTTENHRDQKDWRGYFHSCLRRYLPVLCTNKRRTKLFLNSLWFLTKTFLIVFLMAKYFDDSIKLGRRVVVPKQAFRQWFNLLHK